MSMFGKEQFARNNLDIKLLFAVHKTVAVHKIVCR